MIKIRKGKFWEGEKELGQVEALASLRQHRGWNAEFIAGKTGNSPRTVESWFTGRHKISPSAMVALSRVRKFRIVAGNCKGIFYSCRLFYFLILRLSFIFSAAASLTFPAMI